MSHHSTLRSLRNVAIVIAAVLVAAPAFAQTTSPPQEKPVPLAGGYDNGYLVAQSADGAYKYWLDGRLNLDWAMYRGWYNGQREFGSAVRSSRAAEGVAGSFGDVKD